VEAFALAQLVEGRMVGGHRGDGAADRALFGFTLRRCGRGATADLKGDGVLRLEQFNTIRGQCGGCGDGRRR
jgi:hypothetical protein